MTGIERLRLGRGRGGFGLGGSLVVISLRARHGTAGESSSWMCGCRDRIWLNSVAPCISTNLVHLYLTLPALTTSQYFCPAWQRPNASMSQLACWYLGLVRDFDTPEGRPVLFWSASRHHCPLQPYEEIWDGSPLSLLSGSSAKAPPDPGRALSSVPVVRVTSPGASLEGRQATGDRAVTAQKSVNYQRHNRSKPASSSLAKRSPKTISSLACLLRGAHRAWRVRSALPPNMRK